MSSYTITVVGTGLLGTSLGLALKQDDPSLRLIGHDKDFGKANAAAKLGAFDGVEWNLINACDQADLIILAIPLSGIRPTLAAIAPDLKPGVVISDTCPTKVPVLHWVKETMPAHAHYIGANPLVQPTGSGLEHAAASLFQGRLFCLTPSPQTDEQAVQVMVNLVHRLGAEPFFLDAAEHDGLTTATEHLPALLSLALTQTLAGQPSWRETRKLAGHLFEQVSAGAAGDPDSLRDGFLENKEALLHWFDRCLANLNHLRALISAGSDPDERLVQAIDEAVVARTNWFIDYQKSDFTDPELRSNQAETPSFLRQMVGFGVWRRRDQAKQERRKKG
jgi:prephenate dehydrogenase